MHPNDQHQKLYDKYHQQEGSHENLLNILIKKRVINSLQYLLFPFSFKGKIGKQSQTTNTQNILFNQYSTCTIISITKKELKKK